MYNFIIHHMKRKVLTLLATSITVLIFCSYETLQPRNEIIDEVIIGNQVWMSRNLDTDTFRNGETIPEARSDEEWMQACKERKPAWCYYENKEENGRTYGRLYNWYAVNDPRQICPPGWRVASDQDWKTLENYLGGNSVSAVRMRAKDWEAIGGSTNSSGFSALPGGLRYKVKMFLYLGKNAYWWTSTPVGTKTAICRQISGTDTFVMSRIYDRKQGLSIRCIKDI